MPKVEGGSIVKRSRYSQKAKTNRSGGFKMAKVGGGKIVKVPKQKKKKR